LRAYLVNDKNQRSATVSKAYEEVQLIKGEKVRRAVPGLHYQYFEGDWQGIPDFGQMTAKKEGTSLDFSVGDLAIKKDHFGMRFTGFIEIPEDGMHHFRIRADDAGSLKIHDQLVCQVGIKNPELSEVGDHGAIALKAGLHPVEIDFKEVQGGERLRLYYKTREAANWNFIYLKDFFRTTNRKK
jgi:hexosaminidase